VVAALAAWHDRHDDAARALDGVAALPSHVVLEAYSVLTRLPSGLAVPASTAAAVLQRRFPGEPLRLDDALRRELLPRLAAAGVFGGASYDGVIALEARAHGLALLTLDQRAQETYRRLGTQFELI
jgi:hypothetical protein